MSRLFDLATALATECGAYADGVAVKLAPDYQLGEHEFSSQIYIVPTESERKISSRADAKRVYTYEVGLLKWCRDEAGLKTEVENLEGLAESLLGTMLESAYICKVDTKALYAVEAFAKRKQYIGVLSVEIEDLR